MAIPNAGADVLDIQSVKASAEKVDRVCFHPVQPLLAFADRAAGVTVWNYEANEVVYTNQLGGADEGALQEAALRRRADKDASALGAPPPPPPSPAQEASLAAKNTASGAVHDLQFFDLDTCFWQLAAQRSLQYGAYDASGVPGLGRMRGVHGRRWLVAACENKVTLHDLATSESLDISRSAAFDSRAPTRLAFLLLNAASLTGVDPSGGAAAAGAPELTPVLAVGVSSGVIYLINPTSMTVYAKLGGGHRGAVTVLLPLGAAAPGGPDRLVSASADGSIAVWDPSRTPMRGADREIAPAKTFKAHDSGVRGAAFFVAYAGDKLQELPLQLATVGEDRRLALWDARTWQEVARLQPLPAKASCNFVGFAPWGGAGLGVHPSLVLTSGERAAVMGFDPGAKTVRQLIDLQGRIDPGQKKVPKIYHAAVHPTRPHLIALATNTGAVLLTADANERPAVVALPAQVVTLEALLQSSETAAAEAAAGPAAGAKAPPPPPPAPGGKGAQGLTYVMAAAGGLWSTSLRMASQMREGAAERSVTLEAGPREEIAKLDHPGSPHLACSPSGRSITAVWPELRAYTAYTLAPTGAWEAVDRGSGNCVAWASTAPMYAIISVPNLPAEEVKAKRGFLGLGGGKNEEAEEAAASAAAAAARAAAAATTIQVHVVDEAQGTQFVAAHDVALGGAQPVLLHGGALLGVVAVNPLTLERRLRFFSWRDFSAVGPELPEPVWVAWEPDCTLCALGYETTVELCRTRPAFERFATLSLLRAQAGLWQARQLFVATQSALHLVFADPVQEFVQEVVLASFEGGVASKTAPSTDATPLPPEQMRPAGPVTLAGVRHSYLWLGDAFGRPFIVPLRHPGLRLRCLAARGELTTARTIAERGLSAAFHDDVARFLAAMSPKDGVKEALLLPGLTPAAEMALAIRDGDWDRAARCFQALALGVSDKSMLALAADRAGAGEDGDVADRLGGLALTSSPGRGADHSATVARILDQHAAGSEPDDNASSSGDEGTEPRRANGAEAAEADPSAAVAIDPVDWEAALRGEDGERGTAGVDDDAEPSKEEEGEEEDPLAAAAAARAAAGGAAPMLDAAEAARVAEVAALGLRFADAAADSGHANAARAALGVLVRYATVLPAPLVEELVARMGQCRMTESTRNLAAAAAEARAGSPLLDPGVASLLAALVGGMHGGAVQSTLAAAGLAPQAAVYCAVWGQPGGEAALGAWRSQLSAGAAGRRIEITRPVA